LNAQLLSPTGIQGVFGGDIGGDPVQPLGLGHNVQCQGRLAARFRAKHLHDPPPRNPLPSQGDVQRKASRGNAFDLGRLARTEGHDGAFAEFLLDLRHRVLQPGVRIEERIPSINAFLDGRWPCLPNGTQLAWLAGTQTTDPIENIEDDARHMRACWFHLLDVTPEQIGKCQMNDEASCHRIVSAGKGEARG
jgi:hypothetical protein